MLYRIFIPALEPTGVSMTIDVEASNWMLALRLGLDEIGADRDLVQRAICDIKPDKTIHVMEPVQGRVFVLREVPPGEAALPPIARVPTEQLTPSRPTPSWDPHTPRIGQAPAADLTDPDRVPTRRLQLTDAEIQSLREAEVELERTMTPHLLGHRVDSETMTGDIESSALDYPLHEADLEKYFEPPKPSRAISSLDLAPPRRSDSWVVSRSPTAPLTESAVAEVQLEASVDEGDDDLLMRAFEDMADIEQQGASVEDVLEFSLQRAVSLVPSGAGWLLLADLGRRDLYFAAAVGTKAHEVIEYRLPFGKGIAGFCATNGVSLTLSDVDQDPRFQSNISRQVGLEIRSVACAPIQHEGRTYGALQIMNHTQRTEYTTGELDAVSYIARRVAEYLAAMEG